MSKVNREELLRCLDSVQPGLSVREVTEQSSCFGFKDGYVYSYNDEISCCYESDFLKDIEGAVPHKPLLEILRKLPDEEVDIQIVDEQMVIIGKRRRVEIAIDQNVTMPLEEVEMTNRWKELPEDFADAVSMVQTCAGKDETKFSLTCVHIHPDYIEASDHFQITRFHIKTPIKIPILIRKESIKHVISMGMSDLSVGKTWINFKNSNGLILSCRRYLEDFPDYSKILKVKGTPTQLPKGLGEAADRAEVFSIENADDNEVLVEMRPGKVRIKGIGVSGRYSEIKSIQYTGKAISFLIPPKLLVEITKKHHHCEISDSHLKVNGGKFVYVTVLGKVIDKKLE